MKRALPLLLPCLFLSACSDDKKTPDRDDGAPVVSLQRPAGTALTSGATDAVGDAIAGQPTSLTYTIANTGDAALQLTGDAAVTVSNMVNCAVAIAQPDTTIAAGASDSFDVTVTGSAGGPFSFQLAIASNAAGSPFTITVSRNVLEGEIDLQRTASIANGGTDALGDLVNGVSAGFDYTIVNSGGGPLSLTAVEAQAAVGCTVTASDPGASVAAGANATVHVTVQPTQLGSVSFDLVITSNDVDESPYTIHVSGLSKGPEITVFSKLATFANGGSAVSAGRVAPGNQVTIPIVVRNDGTLPLVIGTVAVVANDGCPMTVRDQPATTTIAPGEASAAILLLTAVGCSGTPSFTVTVPSNDVDEPTFSFDLTATIFEPTYLIHKNATNDLLEVPFPVPAAGTTLSPPISGGATGVTSFVHRGSHAIFVGTFTSPAEQDIYVVPLTASPTAVNLSAAITGDAGLATAPTLSTGDSFFFTAFGNLSSVTRLFHVANGAAPSPQAVEISGSGGTAGVGAFYPSPRGTRVLLTGDYETSGVQDLYVVSVANPGVRRKLNAPLPAGSIINTNLGMEPRWFPDGEHALFDVHSSSGARDLYFTNTSVEGFTPIRVNGVLNPGRSGILPESLRISETGTRIVYMSDEAQVDSSYELYTATVNGNSIGGRLPVNETVVPGASVGGITKYAMNPDGTRLLFTAMSGTAASSTQNELYLTELTSTQAITTKIVSSTRLRGVTIDPVRAFVSDAHAYYTVDVTANNAVQLFFLDFSSSALGVSTALPATDVANVALPAPTGATGTEAGVNVVPHADGTHIVWQTRQGSTQPRLVVSTLSSTPAGLSLTAIDKNSGSPRPHGQTIYYSRTEQVAGDGPFNVWWAGLTGSGGGQISTLATSVNNSLSSYQPASGTRVLFHYYLNNGATDRWATGTTAAPGGTDVTPNIPAGIEASIGTEYVELQ